MPISIQPLDNSLVLHYCFSGAITRADLDTLQDDEARYFDALADGECLHIIADVSRLDTVAADLLPELGQLRLVRDPRVCQTIFAGANPYLRAMAVSLGIFARSGREFAFVKSLDDARGLIYAPAGGKRT